MARCIAQQWLDSKNNEILEIFFQHIGTSWPVWRCELIFDIALQAIFPPNKRTDAWKGQDHTCNTVKGLYYYPITITLESTTNVWFENLRLLQLRKVLNIVQCIFLSLNLLSISAWETTFKLWVIESIVGSKMMKIHCIPRMKKPRMMTTCRRINEECEHAMRRSSLISRQNIA